MSENLCHAPRAPMPDEAETPETREAYHERIEGLVIKAVAQIAHDSGLAIDEDWHEDDFIDAVIVAVDDGAAGHGYELFNQRRAKRVGAE